jgi:hypothetical protein
MTSAILPQMAQSTFRPLLGMLAQNGHNEHISPAEMSDLLGACEFGAAVLDSLFDVVRTFGQNGTEKQKLQSLILGSLEVVETVRASVYARVQALAESAHLPTEQRLLCARKLEGLIARAEAIHSELTSLRHWLERPPSPLTVSELPRGGPYVDLDTVLARMKAGGDV